MRACRASCGFLALLVATVAGSSAACSGGEADYFPFTEPAPAGAGGVAGNGGATSAGGAGAGGATAGSAGAGAGGVGAGGKGGAGGTGAGVAGAGTAGAAGAAGDGGSGGAAGDGGSGTSGAAGVGGGAGTGASSGNGGAGNGGAGNGGAGNGGAGTGGKAGSGGTAGAGGTVGGPPLGVAQTFAVLGGTTVTNTGATIVTGDLGVSSPGVSVTGFPPGVIAGGTIQVGTPTPNQAQADAGVAYGALVGKPCNTPLTGMDLGGMTLGPGVYCFTSSASLSGQLSLDAKNDPNAVFVFQIATTLISSTGSSVVLINGGKTQNLFWQVGTGATLGTGTAFRGTILSKTSITLVGGASLVGRALAQAAVTLDTNLVSLP